MLLGHVKVKFVTNATLFKHIVENIGINILFSEQILKWGILDHINGSLDEFENSPTPYKIVQKG